MNSPYRKGLTGWFSRKRPKTPALPDPNWPDWYKSYYEAFKLLDENLTYSDTPFVVFDTETTGFDVKHDRLLSIGAIQVQNDRFYPGNTFSCFLNPELSRSSSNPVAIHGLLPNSGNRNYLDEATALKGLLEYLSNRVLVAHHLSFDLAMINRALERAGCGQLLNQSIDTVNLARRLSPAGYWSPQDAYTLDLLARRHNIPLSDRHTAMGDSYITVLLFLKLSAKLAARRGRKLQLDDLL